jgi:hypothetical protein
MQKPRRELTRSLFSAALGGALLADKSEAQTCTSPCYPQTAAEIAAGVTPTSTSYPPSDVRRYGAVGNGSTDDGPAFNRALLCAAQATGTGIMKVVYAPKPAVKYVINTAIVNQPGVALDYNGEDISASSSHYQTLPMPEVDPVSSNTACDPLATMVDSEPEKLTSVIELPGESMMKLGEAMAAVFALLNTTGVQLEVKPRNWQLLKSICSALCTYTQ